MTSQATRRDRRAHASRRFCFLFSLAGLIGAAGPRAGAAVTAMLADMSVEQLMQESVTSVSKKETKLSESPAAVSVITGDEIRRIGIESIPEALRLVPGLDVARVDASHWAISSRGFNLSYSNKLLVLMDGRSLYTPSFGGVAWAQQGMVLEDLDRIEVIRGPGATLWGANAVNGVINITSKNSKDTQGLLFSTAAGNEYQPLTTLRYGGEVNPTLHYRTYFQYENREGLLDASGNDAGEDWNGIRAGFRSDWQASPEDLVTVQGDYYSIGTSELVTRSKFAPPYQITDFSENGSSGGNLIARWTRTFSEKSHFSLQSYFDAFRIENGVNGELRRTGDLEAEFRFPLGRRNDLMTGIGYRYTTDKFHDNELVTWNDNSRGLNLFNFFAQDEIAVVPDRLRLTLGSKFERNDYTGWEIQPSARLVWTPTGSQTVWAAASRAVATPARLYRDANVTASIFENPNGGPPVSTVLTGTDVRSEDLDAYELGYRIEATPRLSFDLTGFYNVYDDLIGYPAGTPFPSANPVPHVIVPLDFSNNISGHTYGGELTAQWRPIDWWRLTASYSWLQMNLDHGESVEPGNPQQQAGLQSYLTLPWNMEFSAAAWFVDGISSQQLAGGLVEIPAYIRADLGLIWHARDDLEIGIFGQNLLDGAHPEFASKNNRVISQIPRTVFGRLTWRF